MITGRQGIVVVFRLHGFAGTVKPSVHVRVCVGEGGGGAWVNSLTKAS